MTSLRIRITAVSLTLAVAFGACAPQPVPLEVRFPSTETFLVTRGVRVRVFDAATVSGGCAALVASVAAMRPPEGNVVLDGRIVSPCELRAGISLPDVGGGRRAFVVEGLDRTGNQTIVAGCTEAEMYAGARIEIAVYPTSRYEAAYLADMPAAGETVESRCGGGV